MPLSVQFRFIQTPVAQTPSFKCKLGACDCSPRVQITRRPNGCPRWKVLPHNAYCIRAQEIKHAQKLAGSCIRCGVHPLKGQSIPIPPMPQHPCHGFQAEAGASFRVGKVSQGHMRGHRACMCPVPDACDLCPLTFWQLLWPTGRSGPGPLRRQQRIGH